MEKLQRKRTIFLAVGYFCIALWVVMGIALYLGVNLEGIGLVRSLIVIPFAIGTTFTCFKTAKNLKYEISYLKENNKNADTIVSNTQDS